MVFSALFVRASCLNSLEKFSSPLEHVCLSVRTAFVVPVALSLRYCTLVTEHRACHLVVTWPSVCTAYTVSAFS